jgi:hypothetical protein
MGTKRAAGGVVLQLLLVLTFVLGSCKRENPQEPPVSVAPRVAFMHLTTLPGELPLSNKGDSWSPLGRRLAYQRWNGANYDLLVYDADNPTSPPVLVHSGDFSRIVSWSPDARWLLCVTKAPTDRFTFLYSLVAFPVEVGAAPRVMLSRVEINWGVWGANGKIYWWTHQGERQRIDPPIEWSVSNPESFPDRATVIFLLDRQSPTNSRVVWFRTSPEEEGRFDFINPSQLSEIDIVWSVFPDGRRFIASVPMHCGISAVVDEHGRILTKFWSSGCDEPPFGARVVTSDGQFVVGLSERDENGWVVSSELYLADASAAWKVPIENAPQGWFLAASRVGYSLAYETIAGDSIYVGEVVITPRED